MNKVRTAFWWVVGILLAAFAAVLIRRSTPSETRAPEATVELDNNAERLRATEELERMHKELNDTLKDTAVAKPVPSKTLEEAMKRWNEGV